MKELSIKEKAKRYDEAIEIAKKWKEKYVGTCVSEDGTMVKDFNDIFPELAESGDERIRNNCIHFLNLQKQHHASTVEIDECIAWLEKQGEQDMIPLDKAIKFLDDQLVNDKDEVTGESFINFQNYGTFKETFISFFKRKMLEKQGKENPLKGTLCDVFDDLKFGLDPSPKQGEKKPVWSKEDEKRMLRIATFLWKNRRGDTSEICRQEQDINWLNSLKERVISQPKQEWSEEDRNIIEEVAGILIDDINRADNTAEEKRLSQLAEKIQSLTPQPHWKPSKEQIAALACAMTYLRNKDTRAAAKSLYDDLKALG